MGLFKDKSIDDANKQEVVKKLTFDDVIIRAREIVMNLEDADQLPEYSEEEYENSIVAIQNKVLASSYAVISMEGEMENIKAMEKELAQRKKNLSRKSKWLRDKCTWAFQEFGLQPISSYLKINIGKNPDKLAEDLKVDEVPESYKDIKITLRFSAERVGFIDAFNQLCNEYNMEYDYEQIPDKKAILKALKEGIIVPGASIEKGGSRINIRRPRLQ
jgi:hypothetical protein